MKTNNKQFFQMIHQIITSGHWITDQVSRLLKEYDITEPQYNVLKILKGQNGAAIAVQDIQCRMVQKSSNVTRIVDKLIKKEFVERRECLENRRKMDITITKSGEDYLKKLDRVIVNFYEPFQVNLNTEEINQMMNLLTKLNTN